LSLETWPSEEFQSRPGFSPCLDAILVVQHSDVNTSFNPVLGFLPVSTRVSGPVLEPLNVVSIPSWVFSLSRPLT